MLFTSYALKCMNPFWKIVDQGICFHVLLSVHLAGWSLSLSELKYIVIAFTNEGKVGQPQVTLFIIF